MVRQFVGELGRMVRSPILLATFLAVALVPTLYSGFLIEGSRDPYGQLEKLPIAVVNEDKGALIAGKARNLGDEFVHELRRSSAFGWRFVDARQAEQGMKNNQYYAVITIPAGFSSDASSLEGERPKQAELLYEANSFSNFIAAQIGENATRELRARLAESLSESYASSLLTQIHELSGGLTEASDGAGGLADGARSLEEGARTAQASAGALATGVRKLSDGAAPLLKGAGTVEAGANSAAAGAASLGAGARRLAEGGSKLQQGADRAATGAAALGEGLDAFGKGANSLAAGARQALAAGQALADGYASAADASAAAAKEASGLADDLESQLASRPELNGNAALRELAARARKAAGSAGQRSGEQARLSAGMRELLSGQQKIAEGASSLGDEAGKLLGGQNALEQAARQLSEGLNSLNGELSKLASGAEALAAGGERLRSGAEQVAGGIGRLGDGLQQASDGAGRLGTGLDRLKDGAARLGSGADRLAEKLDDAARRTSEVRADESVAKLLANPVTLTSIDDRKASSYGNGIAPYFISIALFAGSLVFTTVYSARDANPAPSSRVGTFASKSLTFMLMSALQSLAVCTVLVYMLGIRVPNVPLFYAFTAAAGLSFMAVTQAFVTWLDQPGRFAVLVLMILQLASSAGTFPVELLPDWARALHPWLPMTYSVKGFRDAILSGDDADLTRMLGILVLYLAGGLVATALYFVRPARGSGEDPLVPADG